jgi:hypothetical protein
VVAAYPELTAPVQWLFVPRQAPHALITNPVHQRPHPRVKVNTHGHGVAGARKPADRAAKLSPERGYTASNAFLPFRG